MLYVSSVTLLQHTQPFSGLNHKEKISEGAKGACNHASYCSMLFLNDFLV